jgi:predicted RNA-binding protein YlxR (DUF448 family)
VVCRQGAEKDHLLRFFEREGRLALDGRGDGGGRGAYAHPQEQCLSDKRLREKLLRSLGVRSVEGEVRAAVDEAIHTLAQGRKRCERLRLEQLQMVQKSFSRSPSGARPGVRRERTEIKHDTQYVEDPRLRTR